MSLDTIRIFAISKLDRIKRQQKKLQEQLRESPREYLDQESHFVWGKRYLPDVQESDEVPSISLKHNKLVLRIRPGTGESRRHELLERWYRERVRGAVPELIARWEPFTDPWRSSP